MTPTAMAIIAFLTACLPLALALINRRSITAVQADPAIGRPLTGPGSSVVVPVAAAENQAEAKAA
jgi:hypothetical protein